MSKTTIAWTLLASIAGLATAAPAAAQYQDRSGYGYGYGNGGAGYDRYDNRRGNPELAELRQRIAQGIRSGTIDRREGRYLGEQLRQLVQIDRQYGRDGYTRREVRDLRQRIAALRNRIERAQYRRNDRGYDNHRTDRDDRYDRDRRSQYRDRGDDDDHHDDDDD